MSLIGALRVSLGLDSSDFMKGLQGSNSKLLAFGRSVTIIGAGIAAAGVAAFSGFNKAADHLGELKRQADIAGMSVQQFKIAAMAVEGYGVSQEKLSDILKDVNDKFGEFTATGGGELKDFFEKIGPKVGVTIDSFKGLSSSDALTLYVDSLKKANISQSEMTFYMEALANDASALVPAFADGGRAIKDMAKRAEELGLSIDENLIASSRKAQGDIKLVADILGIQFEQAILKIGPALSQLVSALMPAVDGLSTLIKWVLDATDVAGDFVHDGVLYIVEHIGELPEAAAEAAVAFAASLRDGIGALTAEARQWAAQIVAEIIAGLAGLYDAGAAAVDQLWQGMQARFADLKSRLSAELRSIRDMQSGLVEGSILDRARDRLVGRNVQGIAAETVSGYVAGVQTGAAAARAAGASLGEATASGAREALDIHSPSRVMQKIGRFVTDGLGIGITDGSAGAASAMQGLSGQMLDAADGMRSGLSSILKTAITDFSGLRDAIAGVLDDLASKLADRGIGALLDGFFGRTASVVGNDVLSGALRGALGGVPSFAGGGWTGPGSRAGGLDGKGGFLAMMHPRETVTDHTLPAQAAAQAVHVTVGIDQRSGNLTAFVDQRVSGSLRQADRAMPARVSTINRDPLRG